MISERVEELLRSMDKSCQSEARAIHECVTDALDSCPDDEKNDAYVASIAGEFVGWSQALQNAARDTTTDDTKFAELSWVVDDVLTLRPDWSRERAEEFLNSFEKCIRDRLSELGWKVIATFLGIFEEKKDCDPT